MVGFNTGNLGSVGSSEKWTGSQSAVTVTNGSGSLNAASVGLAPAAGDKVDLGAASTLGTYALFAATTQVFNPNNSPTLYYSFLYRFNNLDDVDAAGEIIARVNRQNSGSGVHYELWARSSGGSIQLGVKKPNGTVAYAAKNLSIGQTALIVVRQRLAPGSPNDTVELWVAPAASSLGAVEGLEPLPDATAADGDDDTSATGPGRFYLGSGVSSTFDEFRIASTWAEASPRADQCDPAAITQEPTPAVTVPAGINVTLNVAATGTSPTYQWQVSTNNGANWASVTNGSGAQTATFTSPNLTLADNGKQFRCVVNVLCGGGSTATSQPAIVTVEAPTPTPVGLVMDDNFDDFSRDFPPVTTNNSVWYGTSGSLDANTGDLVGLPASGSSRLWVGYFTDDQTLPVLPVHLAVGRSIKATLVFTAYGITTTPSSSLRIGLFDYADGGTRVSADNFSGSGGNGQGVRGYMLNLNFGTTFGTDEPLSFYARNNLTDGNLMGTTGVYAGLGSGPNNGALNGTEAFVDGNSYTLDLIVTRTGENSVTVGTTITGGGHTWTHSFTESVYDYHRFDAIAIRPNTQESTASTFNFTQFKVVVEEAVIPPQPFNITAVSKPNTDSLSLTWDSVGGRSYHVLSRNAVGTGVWTTNTVTATGASTTYTATGLTGVPIRFFQVQQAP